MAWPNGQGWEVELTVPHAQVPGTGTHADFPVLLTRANLPDAMFDPSGNHCQTDGGDIRAGTASDMGTQLPLEVVGTITLDSASGSGTGKAEIWVKRDLNTTTDTTFWLAWNTAGATSKELDSGTYGRNAVWSGFGAVWHFEETATPYGDSTGNGHDLADVTGTSVDGAGRFTGGGASVDLTSGAQIEAPSAPDGRYMHTVWLKMNPLTAFTPLLRRQQSSFNQYHWLDTDSAAGGYRVEATRRAGATVQADLGETMPFDTWAYAVGRFDATTIEAILDGVSGAALTATEITPFTPNRTYSRPYALLDEARIRPSVNIDHLEAERANQSDPAAFVIPGTPAAVGGGGTTTHTIPVSGGITLAGAGSLLKTRTIPSAGGLSFSGSAALVPVGTAHVITPAGGFSFGGDVAFQRVRLFAPSGGVAFAGAAALSKAHVQAASGGVTFGGTSPFGGGHTIPASGGLGLGGSAPFSRARMFVADGGLQLGGAAPFTVHESLHTITPAGGIQFGGSRLFVTSGSEQSSFIHSVIRPANKATVYDWNRDDVGGDWRG